MSQASEWAFALRERCGCVVAVTVQDDDTLHYVQTVAAWERSAKSCSIERLLIESARNELGRTFEAERLRGRRHWRKASAFLCRPDLAPPPPPPPLSGPDDARAEAAMATRVSAT